MSTITEKRNLTAEIEAAFLTQALAQNDSRKKAFSSFMEKGLPTHKTEEYRFTPITRALEKVFEFSPTLHTSKKANTTLIPGLERNVVVFVNGAYSTEHSSILDQSLNVQVIQESETNDTDPFALLNHAFHTELVQITIGDTIDLTHPINIVYLFDSTQFVFASPRWKFKMGTNSNATLLEYVVGQDLSYFNNKHSVIEVGENSGLEYITVQNGPSHEIQVNNTTILAANSARISCVTCTLSGLLIRNNLSIIIDGQGIDAHLYGLYMISGNTLTDNHSVVDHRKPNSFSNELYKGVMNGNSRGVFNGKIYVRPDAQKTNAFQSNRNILLSETAVVNTKPQLEIWADDVKCSHGCTTGQLDEEALFYLRSRGISKEMSRGMLLLAFAAETVAPVKNELIRLYLDRLITEKFSNGF